MTKLIVYGVIFIAVMYIYRAFRRGSKNDAQNIHRYAQKQSKKIKQKLVKDPHTGEYHVERDEK